MIGNKKGGFSLEFKNFRRARILNKNGYDLANVEINIYTNGDLEEDLKSLKAVTYNLENGKVVETKLDAKSVFKDKISKNRVVKKFTFPNVREGSIIEYEYKLESDFLFNLQPWSFQGLEPRLWSEYNVSVPEFFDYVTLTQGYQSYYLRDRKERRGDFTISGGDSRSNTIMSTQDERTSFSAGVVDLRWVMKDVPPLHEESYTSTLANHVSRIEFQLSELREPFTPKKYMATWEQTCKELLVDEDFGMFLDTYNEWMDDVIVTPTSNVTSSLEKAERIFAFVRDNMTCTNYNRRTIDKPLKNVWKARAGSEAEINLLLTGLLRKAYITADPVLLSTRGNGWAYAQYPLIDRFNYVVTQVTIEGKKYLLDASNPKLGFGKLGYECYNGHARVVNAAATPLELASDSLHEVKLSSIFIINDDKGRLIGNMNQVPGYFESYSLRNRIRQTGKETFFANIRKGFNAEMQMTDPVIDSLEQFEYPIGIRYQFEIRPDDAEILYINPMFGEGYRENPFKSANRLYPIEMPYTMDETYLLRIETPKGYVIDELPKQVKVKLNDANDGIFEYLISESGGAISLRSRIQLKRAFYSAEEYGALREFFNLIVKKHSEQIVFRKKE